MVHWKDADTSYADAYRNIDFRQNPHLYRVGKGEQGVLMTEPYKSEILAIGWRFKTPEIAEQSSKDILDQFYKYLAEDDFVGADMARKFLMMGWTRARRYANHKSGKKYDGNKNVLPQEADALTSDKAQAAEIFRRRYVEAKENQQYQQMKQAWA
jgi:hypothetical protein